MKKINIGIIILNYNSSKDTILLVKDIEAQNTIHTLKIVIVDNNSNDGSIKKSIEGQSLDELNLHKYCCRRMFLANVHLISSI